MIEVTCSCGIRFSVTDQAGGLTADCPTCGAEVDVPVVEELMPLADLWEDLPQGSFKQAGTNVNVSPTHPLKEFALAIFNLNAFLYVE